MIELKKEYDVYSASIRIKDWLPLSLTFIKERSYALGILLTIAEDDVCFHLAISLPKCILILQIMAHEPKEEGD